MTWKREQDGTYTRRCRTCSGSGLEILDRRFLPCQCERMEAVEHPGNSCFDPERKFDSVGYQVERCNACGLFWCVWFEIGDDSVDYPSPEPIGMRLPPDDWRPNK